MDDLADQSDLAIATASEAKGQSSDLAAKLVDVETSVTQRLREQAERTPPPSEDGGLALAAVAEVRTAVDRLAERVSAVEQGVELQLRNVLRRMDELVADLESVRGMARARDEADRHFQARRDELRQALDQAPTLDSPLRRELERLDPAQVQARLLARGYLTSAEVCARLLRALRNYPVVVIEGAPGTGKSDLARLLPWVVLGERSHLVELPVTENLTAEEAVGGLEMRHDVFGPRFGKIVQALIRHLSDGGFTWLFLDESNRGLPSDYLGPVLPALGGAAGFVEQRHALYGEPDPTARIPVPDSFRIVCTENTFEVDSLNKWPEAWDRRLVRVRLDPLRGDLLLRYLELRVLDPIAARPADALAAHVPAMRRELPVLVRFVDALASLADDSQLDHVYRQARVGQDQVGKCVKNALDLLATSPLTAVAALDQALLDTLPQLFVGSHVVLRRAIDKLARDRFPEFKQTGSAVHRSLSY